MFRVVKLPHKNRVLIAFEGNIGEEDNLPFFRELKVAALEVRSADGEFDLLTDWTAASAMPQENARTGEDAVAWCIANGMRKSANVMNTIIQKMQVKRVSGQDERLGYFETREEAEHWLES